MLLAALLFVAYLFLSSGIIINGSHLATGSFNCHYDIDMYNCVNINCKGQTKLSPSCNVSKNP